MPNVTTFQSCHWGDHDHSKRDGTIFSGPFISTIREVSMELRTFAILNQQRCGRIASQSNINVDFFDTFTRLTSDLVWRNRHISIVSHPNWQTHIRVSHILTNRQIILSKMKRTDRVQIYTSCLFHESLAQCVCVSYE